MTRRDYREVYRGNSERCRDAAHQAMRHRVAVAVVGDRVKTLSLADWQTKAVVARFMDGGGLVGVYLAMPGEHVGQVFDRIWEDVEDADAAMPRKKPSLEWLGRHKGRGTWLLRRDQSLVGG